MNAKNFIPLSKLCTHFKVEMSFFNNLKNMGLIEIKTIEQSQYVHQNEIYSIEKMLRMYHELEVNIEGIDVVLNLLQKIEALQNELTSIKNRLRLYEN
jgi:chaperone modulatory protein CbpM